MLETKSSVLLCANYSLRDACLVPFAQELHRLTQLTKLDLSGNKMLGDASASASRSNRAC
jgi:hypothetical protein